MLNDVTLNALGNELAKIAGSLQGHVRSGRRPISVGKLLAKGGNEKVSDIVKTSAGKATLVGTGLVGGMGLYHFGRKANEDRKLGRQMRIQQGVQ